MESAVELCAADGGEPNVALDAGEEHRSCCSGSDSSIFETVVSPELTFYNTSKDVGELLNLSNKLLLAQLDAFCRIIFSYW